MQPCAHTEAKSVGHAAIDGIGLEDRGWASFALKSSAELQMRSELLSVATQLGTPVGTRFGADLCNILTPTKAQSAMSRSLSKLHSDGEFPLHNDTAHWLTPCRYVMLACISPGSGNRPSLFLDTWRVPLNQGQSSLLYAIPLRVTNGRNSFFSTVLSKARPFVRFDPGCMTATKEEDKRVLAIFSRNNCFDYMETIKWERGTALVVDNCRVLHGRGRASCPDPDRRLLRISIR
jgi:hypothetical protein